MIFIKLSVFFIAALFIVSCAYCADEELIVKFKEDTPITTAYGYVLGQSKVGDSFEVEEAFEVEKADNALIFGYYPTETGGIRGYVLLSNLEESKELDEFVEAEKKL